MKTDTSWLILVLSFVLTTHSSQASSSCPESVTKNFPNSTAHMCKDEVISFVTGLVVDVFVPVNTATTCNCSLHASQNATIGISAVRLPDMNCESTLTIDTQRKLTYSCENENNSVGYGENIVRNITPSSNLIELETSNAPISVTYCLHIYSKGGGGSLTLQCHSPDGRSMTSATQSDDKTISLRSTTLSSSRRESTQSDDKTTSHRSTTLSSSRSESTKSEEVDTSSSLTEPIKSEISDTTIPVEKTNIHTDPEAFPVAAAVGGVTGAVLIVAVVVVVTIIYIRKKGTKSKQNTCDDDDGDYVISDVNPNNADTNHNLYVANNYANRYNTDDTTGNTYEHLQHNAVQYVNTPSSVDEDHVYLHVSKPAQSQISDQDYYNTAHLTGSNSLDSH